MNKVIDLILIIVISMCASCSTTELGMNEGKLRELLVNASEDQIMDNLIRGHEKLPMVHVDHSNITANVSTKMSGNVAGGQTLTRAATLSAVRPFTFSLTPERNNVVTLEINPVQDNNAVYQAYLDYLELKSLNGRKSLEKHCYKPEGGHIVRKKGDYWYVVPEDFRDQFFDLSMKTTAMRQPKAPEKPRIAENIIAGFTEGMALDAGGVSATIGISFQIEMPASKAWVTIPVDGVFREFTITPSSSSDNSRKVTGFNLSYPNPKKLAPAELEAEVQNFKKAATGKTVQVWFPNKESSSAVPSYFLDSRPSQLQKALENFGSQQRLLNSLQLLNQ